MSEAAPDNLEWLLGAAKSALELAAEGLGLFNERKPAILNQGGARGLVVEGLRVEWMTPGPLAQRGILGAQAFLNNLVIVENCVARIAKLPGLPTHIKANAERSLAAIEAVVDREIRNSAEHIDHRVVSVPEGRSVISQTIFEGDLFCSTRVDGSLGSISVTQATLNEVARAIDGVVWTPEEIERLIERFGKTRSKDR